jgi:methyl-accepting chemotaxis protein
VEEAAAAAASTQEQAGTWRKGVSVFRLDGSVAAAAVPVAQRVVAPNAKAVAKPVAPRVSSKYRLAIDAAPSKRLAIKARADEWEQF